MRCPYSAERSRAAKERKKDDSFTVGTQRRPYEAPAYTRILYYTLAVDGHTRFSQIAMLCGCRKYTGGRAVETTGFGLASTKAAARKCMQRPSTARTPGYETSCDRGDKFGMHRRLALPLQAMHDGYNTARLSR